MQGRGWIPSEGGDVGGIGSSLVRLDHLVDVADDLGEALEVGHTQMAVQCLLHQHRARADGLGELVHVDEVILQLLTSSPRVSE